MIQANSTEEVLKSYKDFCMVQEVCKRLFERKNAQYGNTIVETGVLGASVELIGAIARLKQLVLAPGDGGESNSAALEDVFKDIAIYGTIALIMLQRNNFKGE